MWLPKNVFWDLLHASWKRHDLLYRMAPHGHPCALHTYPTLSRRTIRSPYLHLFSKSCVRGGAFCIVNQAFFKKSCNFMLKTAKLDLPWKGKLVPGPIEKWSPKEIKKVSKQKGPEKEGLRTKRDPKREPRFSYNLT